MSLVLSPEAFVLLWMVLAVVWLWHQPAGTPWQQRLYPLLPPALAALAWGALPDGAWLTSWGLVAVFLWAGLTLTWVLSVLKRDASLMDIAYGVLLVAVPWWTLAVTDLAGGSALVLVLTCATLGFGRYAVYVLWRNLPHGEDPRYARWRQRHGKGWWWWSYFQVFLLQGVVMAFWCLRLTPRRAARSACGKGWAVWSGSSDLFLRRAATGSLRDSSDGAPIAHNCWTPGSGP